MLTGSPLMEVRAALNSTSHTTGGDARSGIGGVEIQKMIQSMIADSFNRSVDITPMLKIKNINQLAYIWNLRTDLGSTDKANIYSDGGTGTPYPSTKVQLFAAAKSFRADYSVTGLMEAASSSFYDAVRDEAATAIDALAIKFEKCVICGTVTGSYGDASSFSGLHNLMKSYSLGSDTTSFYGIARASGKTYLDCALAYPNSNALADLSLKELDLAITASNKRGAKGHNRVFFCSEERGDEIDELLQPQQRFVAGAGLLEIEGGFSITTYKRIKIIRSRYMDKNGVSYVSAAYDADNDTDTSMYLLDLDHIFIATVDGNWNKHVPVNMGSDSGIRYDERGGYFKSYAVLIMDRVDSQVLIYNLNTP